MNKNELVEFLQAHVKSGESFTYVGNYSRMPAKHLSCKNGFVFSLQASSSHYCAPRENDPPCGYSSFEIGYPENGNTSSIDPFQEDEDSPIYAYVPLDAVLRLIEDNGGLKENL